MVHTVDGRNPAPVDSFSHYLQGFIHPRWLAGFLPSPVVVSSDLVTTCNDFVSSVHIFFMTNPEAKTYQRTHPKKTSLGHKEWFARSHQQKMARGGG